MLRSPFESFGTLGFNHVSFDVCLSGNRVDHVVTDTDIVLIAAACAKRGPTAGWSTIRWCATTSRRPDRARCVPADTRWNVLPK